MKIIQPKLFCLLFLLSIQTLVLAQDEPNLRTNQFVDLTGFYQVKQIGSIDQKQNNERVVVIFQKPQNVTVAGCNTAKSTYNYDSSSRNYTNDAFSQQGLNCVFHTDRSVMKYLTESSKAYFEDQLLVFENKDQQKVLVLKPSEFPQLPEYQPDQEVDFNKLDTVQQATQSTQSQNPQGESNNQQQVQEETANDEFQQQQP